MILLNINNKQQRTLRKIYDEPVKADVLWNDIESLFRALGGAISEGRGSRVRVKLNGRKAIFHRPHPENVTDKGAVKSVRRFLEEAGVTL
ncbi:type II toxin-antitoxin system HicA family toxin [Paenibacillus sp. HB172176]|uniref:type II toxin-antitoxin system HicA family toxin n=1 Tax=Paenibacillus sp. HB172176 TaxID=2493690 RepID=UPI001F0E868E|nr:type II toxin-antitoxin system HicA family toxin [Paenibacillus sp. HB172176]